METDVKQQKEEGATSPAEATAPEKKLSKAEQKIADRNAENLKRLNKEHERVRNVLCTKFLDYFTTCQDPEGEGVRDIIRQCHGQWMLHCKRWNLVPENYHEIKKYCEHIIHNYKKDKYDGEIPPEPAAPQVEEQK